MLECAVNGTGLTVWKVNGVECVTLAHSNFLITTRCMNGQVVGSGNSTDDSCYISILKINMSEDLVLANVECVLDDGTETQVGNITLSVESQGKYFMHNIIMNVFEVISGKITRV